MRALLTDIYKVGSAIVHNGNSIAEALKRLNRRLTSSIVNAQELVSRSEALVRSVIRQYAGKLLSTSTSLARVNLDLEKAITDTLEKMSTSPAMD